MNNIECVLTSFNNECALTTFDNPFDSFVQFNNAFDPFEQFVQCLKAIIHKTKNVSKLLKGDA